MARGRSKTRELRASQLTYADLVELPDYKLRLRVSELVDSVKKAFKEKRRRDCIATSKAILELDPQNDDARFILSWIECDLERDLQLARSLLPDLKKDEALYKNAQLIVQTVLDIDPGNKGAQNLRIEIDAAFHRADSLATPTNIEVDSPFEQSTDVQSLSDSTIDDNESTFDTAQSASEHVDEFKFDPVESETHFESAQSTEAQVESVPEIEHPQNMVQPEPAISPTPEVPSLKPEPIASFDEIDEAPSFDNAADLPFLDQVYEVPSLDQAYEAPSLDQAHEAAPVVEPLSEPHPEFVPVSQAEPDVLDIQSENDAGLIAPPAGNVEITSPSPVEAPPPPQPERDWPPTPTQFQPATWPPPDAMADYLAAQRPFWKRPVLFIGLAILLGAGAFVRYITSPDPLLVDRGDYNINSTPRDEKIESPTATSDSANMGDLEISIDEGVEVFVNDQYVGKAPIPAVKTKPGVYELRYRFDQTELGKENVTIAAGQVSHNLIRGVLGSLEIFVLPASGAVLQIDDSPASPAQTHVVLKPGKHRLMFTAAGYQPQTIYASVTQGRSNNVTVILQPVSIGSTPPLTSSSSPPVQSNSPSVASNGKSSPTGATGKGTLAVSSLLPVDIYLDNNHLGTTPVTLELPAGTYTFEYRYGNLRKSGVNVIKSNELTRTTVVFEVTVQINSTPQSEVSVGGIQRRVLGQTPLAAIRLPIGSTLQFRAPGYPEKSYTVGEKDTTISMVFP